MSSLGEPRKKKETTAGKKPAPLASQTSAKRVVKSKIAAIADPVPQIQNSLSVTEDRIRERAYLKWEAAGRPPGDGANFWIEAQQELMQHP
jgi:hypothetical protein